MRMFWKILVWIGIAVGGFVGGMVLQSFMGVKEKKVYFVEFSVVDNDEDLKQIVDKAMVEHGDKLEKIMNEQKGDLNRVFGRFKEKIDNVVENAEVEGRRKISELINRYRVNQDEKTFDEMVNELRKRFDELEFRIGTTWADVVGAFHSDFSWMREKLGKEAEALKEKLTGEEEKKNE